MSQTPETNRTSDSGFSSSAKPKQRFKVKISDNPLKLPQRSALAQEEPAPPEPVSVKKPQKIKRSKVKRGKKSSKSSKRTAVVFSLLGASAVLIGVAAALIVNFNSVDPVERQLERAVKYTNDENYEKAGNIYTQLIQEDGGLVEAYLGYSDTLLLEERLDDAIDILETGYEATDNQSIGEKLDRLRPEPEEDEQIGQPAAMPLDRTITWTDPAFEKMVRLALDKPSGEITAEDVKDIRTLKIVGGTHAAANGTIANLNTTSGYTIDGQLYTELGDIQSLADAANFPNLKKLTVAYNKVNSASGLEHLQSLETLGLYFNEIGDISPLSSLDNLRFLYIYNNRISDISSLSGLGSLKAVWIQNNQVADLSPLKGLDSLTELYISDNNVSDISPLADMDSLSFFYADGNSIGDISPLAQATSLTDVSLHRNPVSDYAPASNIPNVNRT